MVNSSMRRFLPALAAFGLAAGAAEVLVGQSGDPSALASAPALGGGLTQSGKQAGWRGIYPGRSRVAEVKAVLGEPAATEPAPDGLTRLIYGPTAHLKFNSVYVNAEGLVKKVGWSLFEEQWRVPPAGLWTGFGEPKMLSPYSFVRQGSIYHWPEAAVWGVVDRPHAAVITLVFHDPAETPQIPIPTAPPRL